MALIVYIVVGFSALFYGVLSLASILAPSSSTENLIRR
jgi:hypothetical protein